MTATLTATDQSGLVEINLDRIRFDQQLGFPVYDKGGLLLLAQGAMLNVRIKELLQARGIASIHVHEADAQRLSGHVPHPAHRPAPSVPTRQDPEIPDAEFRTALSDQLDSIFDGGTPQVRKGGPAVRDLVERGSTRVYSDDKLRELVCRNQQNIEQIQDLVHRVLGDKPVDGDLVENIVSQYVKEIISDFDCTLQSLLSEYSSQLPVNPLDVSILAMAIGVEMGLCERNVRDLGIAGLVADWGLLRVPESIRNARRPLTQRERFEYQKHPIYTLFMLEKIRPLPAIVPLLVYQSHERINGSGYPRARSGKEVHPLARMLQTADTFVTLTSRGFRSPLIRYSAMECLIRQASVGLQDSQVVQALLRVYSLFPTGSLVGLSDGRSARTVRSNPQDYVNPVVRIEDHNGPAEIIDLSLQDDVSIVKALPEPGRDEEPFCVSRIHD